MSGLLRVMRAPVLLIAIYVATILAVVPFAIVLGTRLQTALASQQVMHDPAEDLDADIDAEWWFEYMRHARGLDATFTPAIIGAAAPLSSISALIDGQLQDSALLLPIAVYALLWSFLWGGVIERLSRAQPVGLKAFIGAGRRSFAQFAALTVIALILCAVLYATVHAVLFGPVFDALRTSAGSERTAALWRLTLSVIFGSVLILIGAFVDYTRVMRVVTGASLTGSMRHAWRFMRDNVATVTATQVLVGGLFALMLAAYVVVDVYGGARVGGWRGVVIGQVFVLGRLAVRLWFAATAITLIASAGDAAYRSTTELNPGPPAAR